MWHAWERGEKCTGFWWESPKGRYRLEDRGVGKGMGSKWILGKLALGGGGVAQDRDRRQAFVNMTMNLRVLPPRS
jgi:hypothetical protein